MAELTFNTPAGQTVDRELLILYLNLGTASAPKWAPIGKRATDSSMEMDWSKDSKKDVLGNTFSTAKKPITTQTFDPCELDGGDEAQVKIWNLAIKDQDAAALMNQDMLLVHAYAGTAKTAVFAERYASCAVLPSSLGGEGGGSVGMPIEVTFGGTRTVGTAAVANGTVTFTPDGAAPANK